MLAVEAAVVGEMTSFEMCTSIEVCVLFETHSSFRYIFVAPLGCALWDVHMAL